MADPDPSPGCSCSSAAAATSSRSWANSGPVEPDVDAVGQDHAVCRRVSASSRCAQREGLPVDRMTPRGRASRCCPCAASSSSGDRGESRSTARRRPGSRDGRRSHRARSRRAGQLQVGSTSSRTRSPVDSNVWRSTATVAAVALAQLEICWSVSARPRGLASTSVGTPHAAQPARLERYTRSSAPTRSATTSRARPHDADPVTRARAGARAARGARPSRPTRRRGRAGAGAAGTR